MKKTLSVLTTATLMALLFVPMAGAQDMAIGNVQGRMFAGGFFNYGFGFGDQFKDYEESFDVLGQGTITLKNETNLSFSLGGKFFYGVAPKIAIGGVIDYQRITYKGSVEGTFVGLPLDIYNYDESESWTSINGNVMYFFNPDKPLCPYVEGGPGFYIPSHSDADSKFGLNAGGGAVLMIRPNWGIDFGGLFHVIFTEDKSTTYVQINVGADIFFGSAQ
jgi:hypothetical protein